MKFTWLNGWFFDRLRAKTRPAAHAVFFAKIQEWDQSQGAGMSIVE